MRLRRYGAAIINPTTPITPTNPIFKKNFMLTPPTNNKPIIDITKIVPVPKSGCNIIIKNIIKDIEEKIIYKELNNNYEELKRYVLDNYKKY